jgi:hypothetical protein
MSERNQKSKLDNSVLSTRHSVLSFCIADISFDVSTDAPDMKLQVVGAMEKFLVEGIEPDVRVRATWGNLSKTPVGEKVFDSGALWQMYRKNGAYLFQFISSAFGNLPYKVASFNQEFTASEVHLHKPYFNHDWQVYPLEYPLDELLITNYLAKEKGVEVHACGVIDPLGNGLLFAGQSEAGKTTIARIWDKTEGITILSDDRIILRKEDNRVWMYGTPWHGEAGFASPEKAQLTRIFLLRHGEKNNELVPLKKTEASARLFACSFPPFYSREGLEFTLDFLGEIANAVPCYELRFIPDERIAEFILMESRK